MNKLFMFLTCRHFFTLFFFLCLCENLWHSLWEMENKSLNPVCVNNRNVFSWSHIYNCYFEQTADGRIVNIPTSSPERLSMPCLQWGTCCCKGWLKRVPGDHGGAWLSPSSIPFLSCCLLFLFLGPPCFLYPGSCLPCTPPLAAGCFSWHVELRRVWERQLLELMSVLLPELPGQAGCSPGTPSPQSITFSASPSCCCSSPSGRRRLVQVMEMEGQRAFHGGFLWVASPTPEASTPGLWHGWKWCLVSVLSCTHLGRAMGSFDTRGLNDSGCLCFCVTLVSMC